LVNMLLTDLSRLDFRQLFICHKPLFYQAYKSWTDEKKDFVVRFLQQEYAMDKAGARDALFGVEPKMEAPKPESSTKPIWGERKTSGPKMARLVDNELLEVDIESGVVRKPGKAYVSPWGVPKNKKGQKRR